MAKKTKIGSKAKSTINYKRAENALLRAEKTLSHTSGMVDPFKHLSASKIKQIREKHTKAEEAVKKAKKNESKAWSRYRKYHKDASPGFG